jgi:hypothetical protein
MKVALSQSLFLGSFIFLALNMGCNSRLYLYCVILFIISGRKESDMIAKTIFIIICYLLE